MEVHPPEHGIHTWRDFFVHMGTITLGLLIALGLEGLVEHLHHRHLVHTAHDNLRAEVQSNSAVLDADKQHLEQARKDLLTDIQTLRHLSSNADKPHARLTASWTWDGLGDSGYSTARDTGAFTYMPYDEVQHVDAVYTQQHFVDRAAVDYIGHMTAIRRPLQGGRSMADLTPPDVDRILDGCSQTLLDIDLLEAFMRGLHADYSELLNQTPG